MLSPAIPPEVGLYSDLPCAGGTLVHRLLAEGSSTVERSRDGVPGGRMVITRENRTTDIRYRQAIVVSLPNGEVFDYRVGDIEDALGGNDGDVTLTLDPPETDLADCGPIFRIVSGEVRFDYSFTSLTISQILTQFVLPTLAAYGIDWVSIGTIGPSTATFSRTSEGPDTPLALIRWIEAQPGALGARFRYERDGTEGYDIAFRGPPSLSGPKARVWDGLNLLTMRRTQSREPLATGVLIRGAQDPAHAEGVRIPVGYALWRVAGVDAVSTGEITALARTTAGRVLSDDFDRADSTSLGANWTEDSGDFAISTNRLASPSSDSNGARALDTGTETGEQFIQAQISASHGFEWANPGIYARYTATGGSNGYLFERRSDSGGSWTLRVAVNGTFTTLDEDTAPAALSNNATRRLQFYVADGVQEAYGEPDSGDAATKLSDTNTDHDTENTRKAGVRKGWISAGSSGANQCFWHDYARFRSKYLRVVDLPSGSGWKAKVLNVSGDIIAQATESSGTATIDLSRYSDVAAWVPATGWAALIVTDAADVEQWRVEAGDPGVDGIDPGDQFTATLANAWDVELEDPAGGAGPIGSDSMFVANGLEGMKEIPAHYLILPDGTPAEIHASDATAQTVRVAVEPTPGDMVRIAVTSGGRYMTEIHSPVGMALFGRVVKGRIRDEINNDGRTNLASNPAFASWTTKPYSSGCEGNAASETPATVTTLLLRRLEPGFVIPEGAQVVGFTGGTGDRTSFVAAGGGGTADGSGEVTVTLEEGIETFDGATHCVYVGSPPNGYSLTDPGVVQHRPTDEDTDQLAVTLPEYVGAVGSPFGRPVSDFDAGSKIHAGDTLWIPDLEGTPYMIVADAEPDGSEEGFVACHSPPGTSATTGIVTRPSFAGQVFGDAVTMIGHLSQVSATIRTPEVVVIPLVEGQRLWVAATITIVQCGAGSGTIGDSGDSLLAPRLNIRVDDAEVASAAFVGEGGSEFEFDGPDEQDSTRRLSYTMEAAGDVAIEIEGLRNAVSNVGPDPYVIVRGIEIAVSAVEPEGDDIVLGFSGAYPATLLHQTANQDLATMQLGGVEIVTTVREMVERFGLTPPEIRLQEGQPIWLRITDRLEAVTHVERIAWRLDRWDVPSVTLGTVRPTLTRHLATAGV
jgi:hypothetical protein